MAIIFIAVLVLPLIAVVFDLAVTRRSDDAAPANRQPAKTVQRAQAPRAKVTV